jgi:hypothetical protein
LIYRDEELNERNVETKRLTLHAAVKQLKVMRVSKSFRTFNKSNLEEEEP